MKTKNFVIAAIAIFGVSVTQINAQTITFDQTTALIRTFESQKYYHPDTTGPILAQILVGLVQNNDTILGNKHDLVANVAKKKLDTQAANAAHPVDGDTLSLLYYTRQAPLSPSMSEKSLRQAVGADGSSIKSSVANSWKKNEVGNSFIDVLEELNPEVNVQLIDIISQPYFTSKESVYKNTLVTYASESLFEVYYDVRLIELAKRSVVVKILATYGYVYIPRSVTAEFRLSNSPGITILLDNVAWNQYDVPGLQQLIGNPYYGRAAESILQAMGY